MVDKEKVLENRSKIVDVTVKQLEINGGKQTEGHNETWEIHLSTCFLDQRQEGDCKGQRSRYCSSLDVRGEEFE